MKKVTFHFKSGRQALYTGDIVDTIVKDLEGNRAHFKGWVVSHGGYVINMGEVEFVKIELPEVNE